MLNKKRIAALGATVLATGAVVGGTLAYFTDYDSKDLAAKAGTVSMDISDDTTDLTNGLTIINPGDSNPLEFTVSNTGEKSIDVKAVMTVKAPQAFTEADHEYKITDTDGTELEGVLSEDKQTITYTIDDVALAGSVENDEEKERGQNVFHFCFFLKKSFTSKMPTTVETAVARMVGRMTSLGESDPSEVRNASTEVGSSWMLVALMTKNMAILSLFAAAAFTASYRLCQKRLRK